jgi:hypothetical protein
MLKIISMAMEIYAACRMKMVVGGYTLRAIAPCSAQFSATFVCEFSEKVLMVVKTMLVQEPENGFMNTVL